jgi:hypothetical protein
MTCSEWITVALLPVQNREGMVLTFLCLLRILRTFIILNDGQPLLGLQKIEFCGSDDGFVPAVNV